jgi:hypothetical protein
MGTGEAGGQMTGIVQTPHVTERPSPGDDYLPPAPSSESESRGSSRPAGTTMSRIAWVIGGATGVAAIVWFIFFGPGEDGAKAQWFFGATVLVAVLFSLWQTHRILCRAASDAADAEERLGRELANAQERSTRELALVRSIHEAEMDSQRQLARAELAAQVELARVERVALLAQQQKLAMVEVSRAVNAQTHALATLWNESVGILTIADRETRAQAMNPIFEQIGHVVNDFAVELANAHLLIEDDRIHRALDRVNEAVLAAMHVAEDVHFAVIDGDPPKSGPMTAAQRLMHERAAEARHLAWSLLRAGLDDPS